MPETEDILYKSRTVDKVGLSPDPERPSHVVAKYLKENVYIIIPVNPNKKGILGEKSCPDLASVPVSLDVVDIFRRSEDVLSVICEAIITDTKAIWMQEGIVNKEAAAEAKKVGLKVVMDKCMRKEHLKISD